MKPFTWLLGGPHLILTADLKPEEFARRFAEAVDRPYRLVWSIRRSSPILGSLHADGSFRLQERCGYRNSGLPYFYGHVRASGSGSEIRGHFGAHPFTIAIMLPFLSWLALLSAAWSLFAAASLIQGDLAAAWEFAAFLMVFIGVAAAAVLTTVISKKKEAMYLAFFRDTFGARLVDRKE